jgi:hypothetical protein
MSDPVRSSTPGCPRVLIVDLTRNERGFEHALSNRILAELKSGGIELAEDCLLRPQSDEEYAAILTKAGLEFNVLLLLGHGGEDPGDGTASVVATPSARSNWYRLAELTSHLRDKLICLAVCLGYCTDVVYAFLKSDPFALAVVAPMSTLSSTEAGAFFPAFLKELNDSTTTSIHPELVQLCVENNNRLERRPLSPLCGSLRFGVQPILNVIHIFSATLLVQFVCTTTDLIHRRFFSGRVDGRNRKGGFTVYRNSFLGDAIVNATRLHLSARRKVA